MFGRLAHLIGFLVAALLPGSPVSAELPSQSERPHLPSGFIGAGLGPSTNDAASRMRLYEEELAFLWLAEGGFAVAERVGLGVELSRPSAATAFTTVGLGRAQISGRQEETVVVGLLRARLGASKRAAFDVVGGAGVVFQHHETGGCVPAQVRCDTTDGPSLDEKAPVLAVGFDVPIRLAVHFEVTVTARTYFLRRGEHTTVSENDFNLIWQYEWRSSTRTAILLAGRVVW